MSEEIEMSEAIEPNELKEVTPQVRRKNIAIAITLGLIAMSATLIPVWTASRMGILG